MSIQHDIIFLKKINLVNFKQIEKHKFNFRCPICEDSKKSKFKSRGYAMPHKSKDALFIYCHNCEYQDKFYYFLKELKKRNFIDDILFNSYIFQGDLKNNEEKITIEDEKEINFKENRNLINVNRFKNSSIVKQYLFRRKIDEKFFNEIYFSLNFKQLINTNYVLNKYENEYDIPRIVFPIFNRNNEKLIGFQGRTIYTNDNYFRYLNIKFNDNDNFIFEQKDIDINKIIFITEGIFDCLILRNSISMLGSTISKNKLAKYKKVIFIFDNERQNFEIIKKYKKIINENNIGLFIWPKNIKYKDINEWAMNERKEKIEELILENSYFNVLEKNLHFLNWI